MSRHQTAGQHNILQMLINPLKMWLSSNIWEQLWQVKIPWTKKITADQILGTLPTILFRVF